MVGQSCSHLAVALANQIQNYWQLDLFVVPAIVSMTSIPQVGYASYFNRPSNKHHLKHVCL
jgi:hypothetical protein